MKLTSTKGVIVRGFDATYTAHTNISVSVVTERPGSILRNGVSISLRTEDGEYVTASLDVQSAREFAAQIYQMCNDLDKGVHAEEEP